MPKKSKKIKIRQKAVRIQGVFAGTSGSFGFVRPDEAGPDYFIPPKFTGNALDGDTVEVEQLPERQDRFHPESKSAGPVGKITRILARGRDVIMAELIDAHSARPMNRKLPETIKINSLPRGVKRGSWVKLRLLKDGSKHTEAMRASVDAVLGKAGTVEGDLAAIEQEYKLAEPYSTALELAASRLHPLELDRTDLRDLFTITVDPSDAHDFDDAISIQPGEKSTEVILGVHISDVAAWITPGSKFDKEAWKRSFSSYIPGMFRPMLPKKLTAKISLRQNEDSMAHTILFTVRKRDGKILCTKRCHSVIRVNARLTYDQLQAYMDDPKKAPEAWTGEFKKNIKLLVSTVVKLRKQRFLAEKFLLIPTAEVRVTFDEKTRKITGLERREEGDADRIVEECMLAANSAVAKEIFDKRIAGMFRVHPKPAIERVEDFCSFVQSVFQINPGDILSSRENCLKFLQSLPDDHTKPVILSKFLRMLPRASYFENPEYHYGLGKSLYSHFTSPIRRYPDLLIHQQLLALDLNTKLRSKKAMSQFAQDCSDKEENNDNAFFAANDRMKIHYLKQFACDENRKMYEAVICKVNAAGLVCDIPELGLYGTVPVEKLRGGQFRKNGKRDKIRSAYGHTEYKVGDFIYLILDSLDTIRGIAIFRPAI